MTTTRTIQEGIGLIVLLTLGAGLVMIELIMELFDRGQDEMPGYW